MKMDKIQMAIREMNTLGFDQISIRATVLQSSCFVFDTRQPEGSEATVKYSAATVENSVIGALEALRLFLAIDGEEE